MKAFVRILLGLLVSAFMFVGVAANQAIAQEKGKAISMVLTENDKVRVLENRLKPGDVNESPPALSMRVVRVLSGGTLFRTYADGKTETVEFKTGQTMILAPSAQAYTTKNIGKTEIVFFIVVLK